MVLHRLLLGAAMLGGSAGAAGAQSPYGDSQGYQAQGNAPSYPTPGYSSYQPPGSVPAGYPSQDYERQGREPQGYEPQGHEPISSRASNIDQSDTRSAIAPSLPVPPVGPNSDPRQYLVAAEQAIAARRTGMAQEALERAESRLLDRSVAQGQVNSPDDNSAVAQIAAARHALASGDLVTASNTVQLVLSGMSAESPPGQPMVSPTQGVPGQFH